MSGGMDALWVATSPLAKRLGRGSSPQGGGRGGVLGMPELGKHPEYSKLSPHLEHMFKLVGEKSFLNELTCFIHILFCDCVMRGQHL